jgi:hypothetical protein
MSSVWAVVAGTGGAWEAECVYSLWTTPELAQAEVDRLVAGQVQCGCNSGSFYVVEVAIDTPADEWIS